MIKQLKAVLIKMQIKGKPQAYILMLPTIYEALFLIDSLLTVIYQKYESKTYSNILDETNENRNFISLKVYLMAK